MERTANKKLLKTVTVGLMAALVFVGNYFQIPIPNGVLLTRIHLGNSMCLLAGLLFCGSTGGLASGIGAALFDLTSPAYVLSAPYTFISKFAMGFVAGKLNRRNPEGKIPLSTTILAAVAGQATYIILYLIKTYFTMIVLGSDSKAAWAAVGTNAISSCVNAVISIVIAVPLYIALRAALVKTPIKPLINEQAESKGYFNPVTVGLTVFAFVISALYAMDLSAQSKLDARNEQEKAELEERLEDYENRLNELYEELGIPQTEAEGTE